MNAVDNNDAVWEACIEAKSSRVMKPKFTAYFPGAVRERADDLTLRAHEEGALCT